MIARVRALRRRERERSRGKSMCPAAADRGIAIIPPCSSRVAMRKHGAVHCVPRTRPPVGLATDMHVPDHVSERFVIIRAVCYCPRKATAPWMSAVLPPFVGIATRVMRAIGRQFAPSAVASVKIRQWSYDLLIGVEPGIGCPSTALSFRARLIASLILYSFAARRQV
jgi:hypothetical protein